MRLLIIFTNGAIGILVLLPQMGCASQNIPTPAQVENCTAMRDLIGLSVYLRRTDGWHEYSFGGGKLIDNLLPSSRRIASDIPGNNQAANETHELMYFEKRFSRSPNVSNDLKLAFPAEISPDRQWIAAALQSRPQFNPPPIAVAIQEMKGEGRVLIYPQWSIETLAWAPTSDRVALVEERRNRAPGRPSELITGVFGWRGSGNYNDVAVSVYSRAGNLVCRTILGDHIEDNIERITWH
jgi:hypothetical protein